MKRVCPTCGEEQELVAISPHKVLHALPDLRFPLEIVKPFACPKCGREISTTTRFVSTDRRVELPRVQHNQSTAERRFGRIVKIDNQSAMSLIYRAASVRGDDVLFPVHEGYLGADRAIDRYGNPDLMAEFATEYLKQYRTIAPRGRLPKTLTEMMPGLHMLVSAAELALKADLIRSGKKQGGHHLTTLFRSLEDEHREEVERRFARAEPMVPLNALRTELPTVEDVLGVYDSGSGGTPVYMLTRYFAEPTTMFHPQSVKGRNLIKTVPYPIFLPVVVQTMLDVYAYFSGPEQLQRLGADIAHGMRDPGNNQHGDWGLLPSSIDLVVIRVAQQIARDEQYMDRDIFRRFKTTHPPGYTASWMYGGQSLLFYRAGEDHPDDGDAIIDGLECNVWYSRRLGMHSRDLYLLADALRNQEGFPILQWTNSSKG